MECPKNPEDNKLSSIYKNYQARLNWEKYMNPKGLKPTITSNFPKEGAEIDFVSHTARLTRSHKPYDKQNIMF